MGKQWEGKRRVLDTGDISDSGRNDNDSEGDNKICEERRRRRRKKRKQEIFKRRWMKCWIASREIDNKTVDR